MGFAYKERNRREIEREKILWMQKKEKSEFDFGVAGHEHAKRSRKWKVPFVYKRRRENEGFSFALKTTNA